MISVKEAKARGLIKPEYHKYLKDFCDPVFDGCGSPLMLSDNLTQQFCSNPRCCLKLAGRANRMLDNFGVQGYGQGYLRRFFRNQDYKSHLAIFLCDEEDLMIKGYQKDGSMLFRLTEDILDESYTFPDLVSRLALPELNSDGYKLFEPFPNYTIFKEYLKMKDLTVEDYIKSVQGFGNIKAPKIAEIIKTFEFELSSLEKMFQIKLKSPIVHRIVMTGKLQFYYMTKEAYLKHINRVGAGIVECVWDKDAPHTCEFIISADADKYLTIDGEVALDHFGKPIVMETNRNKHNIGVYRNKYSKNKILMTPQEFKDYIIKERDCFVQ